MNQVVSYGAYDDKLCSAALKISADFGWVPLKGYERPDSFGEVAAAHSGEYVPRLCRGHPRDSPPQNTEPAFR